MTDPSAEPTTISEKEARDLSEKISSEAEEAEKKVRVLIRREAGTLATATIDRIGVGSPLQLLVCDPTLFREFAEQFLVRDAMVEAIHDARTAEEARVAVRAVVLAKDRGIKKRAAALTELGAIEAIAEAMRAFKGDVELALYAIVAFGNVAEAEESRPSVGARGGIEAIIATMAALHEDPFVQENGCMALYLLNLDQSNRSVSSRSNVIQGVLAAMKSFPQFPGVQEAGCRALTTLAYDVDIARALAGHGALEAVRLALETHVDNAAVAAWGSAAIHSLVVISENKVAAAEKGVITAITKSMHEHLGDRGVQERGLGALHSILSLPEQHSRWMSSEVTEAVWEAEKAIPESPIARNYCDSILHRENPLSVESRVRGVCSLVMAPRCSKPCPAQRKFICHSCALSQPMFSCTTCFGPTGTERTLPFNNGSATTSCGFAVACGLEPAVEWLQKFRIEAGDVEYLATLRGNDGTELFERGFLEYLREMGPLRLDIDAIPEGTVVFPHEPLIRVRGPILQAQIVETALLCLVNFHTLVATKAARVCGSAGEDEPVLEFGLRRAQGLDGALAASRAAFIGGCASTSNVLAGRRYGIPVRGTHAHSWVMSFGDELEAFREYARASPNNCVFLVDTFDTLCGVANAIEVGKELRRSGHRLAGIRLDSGDLAYLSIRAREMLDAAGFTDTQIIASNDLDEHIISSLKQQGSSITVWGVGTKLVTAFDQPALGGVYKLAATRDRATGDWKPCIKLSEQAIKVSNPGILNVRRFTIANQFAGDVIWDELCGIPKLWVAVDPADSTRRKIFPEKAKGQDLLIPIMRAGQLCWKPPPLSVVRDHTKSQIAMLHPGIRRLANPHEYPSGLDPTLLARKTELIMHERELVRITKERLFPPPTTPSPPESLGVKRVNPDEKDGTLPTTRMKPSDV